MLLEIWICKSNKSLMKYMPSFSKDCTYFPSHVIIGSYKFQSVGKFKYLGSENVRIIVM